MYNCIKTVNYERRFIRYKSIVARKSRQKQTFDIIMITLPKLTGKTIKKILKCF